MLMFSVFVLGLWVSDAANEWKRHEPWGVSAAWSVFTALAVLAQVLPQLFNQ